MLKDAPLETFKVIGVEERTYQAAPGAPVQAAGTCWHCGIGIKICVVAKQVDTGEVITVGTTCAERVGLDPAGLKKHLAEKFPDERQSKRSKAWQTRVAQRESRKRLSLKRRLAAMGVTSGTSTDAGVTVVVP